MLLDYACSTSHYEIECIYCMASAVVFIIQVILCANIKADVSSFSDLLGGLVSTPPPGFEPTMLLLFRHSAKILNAQDERLATSP